jgi:hypothetical protein
MTGTNEQARQKTCGWCGKTIVQSGKGRPRLYCDRSCRQRAYEQRTATALYAAADLAVSHAPAPAEHGADSAADHLSAPMATSIEQAAEADYPLTPTGWVKALDELAARIRHGHIRWPHVSRIYKATFPLVYELEQVLRTRPVVYSYPPHEPQDTGRPIPDLYIDMPDGRAVPSAAAARAVDRLLNLAHADPQPVYHTTIEALGERLDTDPELIRQALMFLWSGHYALAIHGRQPTNFDRLNIHDEISLFLRTEPLR